MKKILFVLTNFRVFEKYTNVLIELAKQGEFEMHLYFMGQASVKTPWPGDVDKRELFQNDIAKYSTVTIFNGTGLSGFGQSCKDPFREIEPIINYVGVWYDDNRTLPAYSIPQLYYIAKNHKVPMIGNSHGNQEFTPQHQSGLGKVIDHVMLLGPKEVSFYSNFHNTKQLHAVGIPSNDKIKNYSDNGSYILCISNFLANHKPLIFGSNFDREWASMLDILSRRFNLPIVIKQKGRLDDLNYNKNITFIKDCFFGLETKPTIISDVEDDIKLISEAKYVISAPSTLAFKALQLLKPTIILNGAGQIGNFDEYPYRSSIHIENIVAMLKDFDKEKVTQYLEETITGSTDFSSTDKYITTFKQIINE